MNRRQFVKTSTAAGGSFLLAHAALAEPSSSLPFSIDPASQMLLGVPLSPQEGADVQNLHGIPFLKGMLQVPADHPAQIDVVGEVRRIYFLGMTESGKASGWSDPLDYSRRYFIGDEVGQIQLDYADGTSQVFPLVLGQGIWWGPPFNRFQEPFPADTRLREAFADSMRLYPPTPVEDGIYAAVITPKATSLKSIVIHGSAAKQGAPVLTGITLEAASAHEIAGTSVLVPGALSPAVTQFFEEKPLRSLGTDQGQTAQELTNLKRAVYSSNESFTGPVALQKPPEYSGPGISFKGGLPAEILANAFCYNVQDSLNKIDDDGMYHTSTKGAVWWNDAGFGSEYTGKYYGQSWSRDLGRSLQELSVLGFLRKATPCAGYALRMARLWQETPSLKFHGGLLPPHWGRIINQPAVDTAFENDGHGLIIVFLYKLWQRLPNRDEWLRANWPDVKAAGDWVLWLFAHPEISGATDGVLRTTGESAGGNGYSAYPDCSCFNALRALAQMADAIGETDSATQWRQRAQQMQEAIGKQYIVNDPKYGRAWKLEFAGWPYKTTVLGPLILSADYEGFAPGNEDADWRVANQAAYQRLIDTYQPFGFYGLTMGYGQGFVTQSALLLDRMHDATVMLDWLAKEIYDPRFGCFIVSEGVQLDPTGKFWYRFGDLGNGVQEMEIVKTLRLVLGVDDTQPARLQFYPRMPYGWIEMAVDKYPVLSQASGRTQTAHLHYKLVRSGDTMQLEIGADNHLGPVAMRLGPFAERPSGSSIRVNGRIPASASVEHQGDSWWVNFKASVGPEADSGR
jgi:hypothetical protein